MFSISFLLLGNNLGYAVGGSSLLLLGFFILFSCYNFYDLISKEITADPPPEKKSPEVPVKKSGTNFPTDRALASAPAAPRSPGVSHAAEPVKAPRGPGVSPVAPVKEIENPEEIENI